ncbi:MAG TPA: low temperature requirement protein A [Solirubrobacteraceae bacterium]|nr:low temperature requirement protein A [Solirubrobacteraceae bacterium]
MAATVEPTTQAPAERVSTLELFFDLVFVFTVTQLTAVLTHDLSLRSFGQVVVMLALIWWMYGGYAWLTNSISTRGLRQRVILLGGMAGYLVLALAVPGAFHGSGLAFGVGYLIVVAVHSSLFIWTASAQSSRAFLGIAPYNLFNALLVVVGGAVGGTAQAVLWTVAAVLEWSTPWIANREAQSGFAIAPAHFVERHGLVVIVAIGESVVAIGIGAAGLAVDAELVLVAVLGLLLSAGLWWAYFGADDDEQAERALAAAPAARQPWIALEGFGLAHYVLLLGIVLVAAGLKKATGHPYDALTLGQALTLGGGVALFLAADVWFRRVLSLGRSAHRALAALLALATIPVGSEIAAVAQLGALVVILAVALAGEGVARSRPTEQHRL